MKLNFNAGIIYTNPMDVLSSRENCALLALGGRTLILVFNNIDDRGKEGEPLCGCHIGQSYGVSSTRENYALPAIGGRSLILLLRGSG